MPSNRIERLPFTVYDILGYFVPGLVLAIGLVEVFCPSLLTSMRSEIPSDASTTSLDIPFLYQAFVAVGFFVAAYVVGQLLALVAGETHERLVLGFVGYPSSFLVRAYKHRGDYWERDISKHAGTQIKSAAFWLSFLLHLPTALMVEILVALGLTGFLVKPLKPEVITVLKQRLWIVFGVNADFQKSGGGWFELVESYVVKLDPGATARMYNYVTLYGFHRNVGTSAAILFWIHLVMVKGGHETAFVNIWTVVGLAAVSVGSSIGFVKFWRRYSREAVRSFVIEANVEEGDK
jgi:hypothetical protein